MKINEEKQELQVYDISEASVYVALGMVLVAIKNDNDGKYYFVFENSVNNLNTATLYRKQYNFLLNEREKQKDINNSKIRGHKTKYGFIKEVYKESKARIKGAPKKVNGVWKSNL